MKSFFIVQHEMPRTINDQFLVREPCAKSEILKETKIKNLNIDNYDFYDDSSLSDQNKFISMYHESIFSVYFPRVKEGNEYVYYPKPKIIKTPDSTVYVNRWNEIDVSDVDIQSIVYISDNSDKEEHQRVMTVFTNKSASMESNECEQTK